MTLIAKIFSSIFTVVIICLASMQITFANDFKIADLEIRHPHAQAPFNNARVTGGYITIINNGSTADKLIAVKVVFAEKAEIHEMKMENDIMKMRALEGGLSIPANRTTSLSSGANHIMFTGLKEKLNDGDKRKAILVFEKAGEIEISFSFETLMKIKMRAKKNSMKMKAKDHGEMIKSEMINSDMDHKVMDHKNVDKTKHN